MKTFRRFAETWLPAIAAVLFVVAAIYTFLGSMSYGDRAVLLRDTGIKATGTVAAVTMSAGTISEYGRRTDARYYITYDFMDSIGVPQRGMSNGTGPHFAELASGDSIPVIFLGSDPQVSIYDTGVPVQSSRPLMFAAMLLGLAALIGYLAFTNFRKPARKT